MLLFIKLTKIKKLLTQNKLYLLKLKLKILNLTTTRTKE